MEAPSEKAKRRLIRRSRDEWRARVVRFQKSGKRREQFCIEQGVISRSSGQSPLCA